MIYLFRVDKYFLDLSFPLYDFCVQIVCTVHVHIFMHNLFNLHIFLITNNDVFNQGKFERYQNGNQKP